MAALVATNVEKDVWGRKRITMGRLANVADADTWAVPGLTRIDHILSIVPVNASYVAADELNVASFTGNTITFQAAAGTDANRDVHVTVAGI